MKSSMMKTSHRWNPGFRGDHANSIPTFHTGQIIL